MTIDPHRAQIETVLVAWGMSPANARTTADVLIYADLRGIDGHGISSLIEYDERRRRGRHNLKAEPVIAQETPLSAVIDGDGGLGHVPARLAMETAIAKAGATGVGMVAVRNSGHIGACGYYTVMAADAGLIGIVTSSASRLRVAPTFGAIPRFGTDPLSFAAPTTDGRPFVLDMSTTTVAGNRVRIRADENASCPPGWILTRDGHPTQDPLELLARGGLLTPLGGTPEGASYKGYGLSMMVNILSSCLTGATLVTDPMHTRKPQGMDIGHFVVAIDPALFRDPDDFRADVTRLCNDMRATPPVDPANPVRVAGDPEREIAAERSATGIPIPLGMRQKLRKVATEAGVPWLLG